VNQRLDLSNDLARSAVGPSASVNVGNDYRHQKGRSVCQSIELLPNCFIRVASGHPGDMSGDVIVPPVLLTVYRLHGGLSGLIRKDAKGLHELMCATESLKGVLPICGSEGCMSLFVCGAIRQHRADDDTDKTR